MSASQILDHHDHRTRHDRNRLEFEQADSREPYHHKSSIIHGWVTKMRGTLSGNERVRSDGLREMRRAATIREYKHKREMEKSRRSGQGTGLLSRLFSSGSTSKRPTSARQRSSGQQSLSRQHTSGRHHTSDKHRSTHRDRSDRARGHAKGNSALLHFPNRAKPHHHGQGTHLKGVITRNRELMDVGREMNDRAARERERERRRRHRQNRKEADALKSTSNRWNFHK